MKRTLWVLVVGLVVLTLAACLLLITGRQSQHTIVDLAQPSHTTGMQVELEPGQPVGQTFLAHHAGLAGLEFYLLPENRLPLTLSLHLRADPESSQDLAVASLELAVDANPGFYRFTFAPQTSSHGQYYYAFVEASAPGVSVALAEGNTYLDGAAHQAHSPLDAQTTFQPVYATADVALDLLSAAAGWLGLLAVTGLLFVGPGWALLAWFGPGDTLSWAEILGLAPGLSLALYTLLVLWTDLVGLRLGTLYAWLPALGALAALAWRYRRWRPRTGRERLGDWVRSTALWPDLALLAVLGLVFGVRLLVVRTLDVPLWGDSYHHTMIAQLLADRGGLFDSWLPYAPLKSFTYHFGFHLAVTLHHWLTGTEIVPSVILVGQTFNGLAVLSLYPLATKLSGSRWAGVATVLAAGLLSPMPMYYTNWGRYVQLTGQVVLPVAAWLLWTALESRPRCLALEVLTGASLAGLLLAHYRVTLFFLLLVPIAWVGASFQAWRQKRSLTEPSKRLVRIGLSALLLALPWLLHLFAGFLPRIFGEFTRTQTGGSLPERSLQILHEYASYAPVPLLVVALLGLAASLLKRKWHLLLAAVWVGLLFLAANPNWLGLPGAVTISNFDGVLNSFTVLLALYMPVSLASGYLVGTLADVLPRRLARLWQPAAAALLLVLALFGARDLLTILKPGYFLVTRPDVQAAQWIETQTPETARFLTNYFFAYEENVIVGSDAGWWLPLLAQRANTTPPITYGHEDAYEPDYVAQVNAFGEYLEGRALDDPETIQVLQEAGITHVFIGQKGGNLSLEALEASDAYRLIYHRDRVWIFEIE